MGSNSYNRLLRFMLDLKSMKLLVDIVPAVVCFNQSITNVVMKQRVSLTKNLLRIDYNSRITANIIIIN